MMKKILYIVCLVLVISSCESSFPTWEEYNTQWLEDNVENLGISAEVDTFFVLPSGVQCEIMHMGFGATPKPTIDPTTGKSSYVKVKYRGELADGVVFDKTDSTSTAGLYLGDCIEGWQQSLSLVKQGSHLKIYVPAEEGYGSTGSKDAYGNFRVPPHSTLIFDIELVDVINF